MEIYGVDFTSSPSAKKPLAVAVCVLEGRELRVERLEATTTFVGFEHMLWRPGPWVAGLDFPFGLPRRFLENIGWPLDWSSYVARVASAGKEAFVGDLTRYRESRLKGDREHRRQTDVRAQSISPQKLFGTPLARMFFEGAPRLLHAGTHTPPVHATEETRIAVEAYPGVLVRSLFGRTSYKNDQKKKQTPALRAARSEIVRSLRDGRVEATYGVEVLTTNEQNQAMIDDGGGDRLDAVLCAVQAAWAYQQRARNYGIPMSADALEGWIVDPVCLNGNGSISMRAGEGP